MATDNTPPRLRLIVTIAVIVVITLLSLEFVFKSYFAYMTDEARLEKTAPKTALLAQIVAEKEAFGGAAVPIDQAMKQIAKGTRPALIDPKPSDDLAPLTGWNKMPKQPPAANDIGGAAADAGVADASALATGDAGSITDGGAAMTDAHATTNDAGATAPTPAYTGMKTAPPAPPAHP